MIVFSACIARWIIRIWRACNLYVQSNWSMAGKPSLRNGTIKKSQNIAGLKVRLAMLTGRDGQKESIGPFGSIVLSTKLHRICSRTTLMAKSLIIGDPTSERLIRHTTQQIVPKFGRLSYHRNSKGFHFTPQLDSGGPESVTVDYTKPPTTKQNSRPHSTIIEWLWSVLGNMPRLTSCLMALNPLRRGGKPANIEALAGQSMKIGVRELMSKENGCISVYLKLNARPLLPITLLPFSFVVIKPS